MSTYANEFEFNGHKAAFLSSMFALVLNAHQPGEWVEARGFVQDGKGLGTEAVTSGFVSAFLSAFKAQAYSTLELGLHLLKSAEGQPFCETVGYVTAAHKGAYARFAPAEGDGVNVLGTRAGILYVANAYRASEMPLPVRGESDEITKARNIVAKHLAMDQLIRGTKVYIAPAFFKGGFGTEERKPDWEARKAWVAKYLEIFSATVEENQDSYAQQIAQKAVNQVAAQAYKLVETGVEIELPSKVFTVDGKEISVIDLLGHTIRWYQGKRALGAETGFKVTPENFKAKLATIAAAGLRVQVLA